MTSLLVALALLLQAILDFKTMCMHLCAHDSTWCWWHSNKVRPLLLKSGPYPELIRIGESLSTEFSPSYRCPGLRSEVQQGLQSRCSAPCVTYRTAGRLCYITKDIETNHIAHTVLSTNIRITENPQEKKKINQPPSLLNPCVVSLCLYRKSSHK